MNKCEGIELVELHKLTPHPKNPNKHPKEQIERLVKVIDYQGFRNPLIVSNLSGFIVAGHGRLEAAKILKIEKVPVIFQDFENEAMEYAHLNADNALALWAELDLGQINTDFLDLGPDLDIDMLGIKDFVIEPIEKYDEEAEDNVPEVENPITVRGDVWLLGEHRVMCGDSTMIDDVEKLMDGQKAKLLFTSPPYSDMRDYNGKKDLAVDNLAEFITAFSHVSEYQVINLGLQRKNNEVHDYWSPYIDKARDNGYLFLSWNIWDKGEAGSIGNQTAMFPIEHEWIFVFGKKKNSLNKTIDCKYAKTNSTSNSTRNKDGSVSKNKDRIIGNKKPMGTVYKTGALKARNLGNSHPAAFTVDFAEGYIEAMTNIKDLTVEPFCGSGSTLIACEKTNRKCYGMELDEHYCDVICKRWADYTGKKPILEATGQTYDELKMERNER